MAKRTKPTLDFAPHRPGMIVFPRPGIMPEADEARIALARRLGPIRPKTKKSAAKPRRK